VDVTWDDVIFVTLTLQAGAARAGIHKSRPRAGRPIMVIKDGAVTS
jgi:hypothetical protein